MNQDTRACSDRDGPPADASTTPSFTTGWYNYLFGSTVKKPQPAVTSTSTPTGVAEVSRSPNRAGVNDNNNNSNNNNNNNHGMGYNHYSHMNSNSNNDSDTSTTQFQPTTTTTPSRPPRRFYNTPSNRVPFRKLTLYVNGVPPTDSTSSQSDTILVNNNHQMDCVDSRMTSATPLSTTWMMSTTRTSSMENNVNCNTAAPTTTTSTTMNTYDRTSTIYEDDVFTIPDHEEDIDVAQLERHPYHSTSNHHSSTYNRSTGITTTNNSHTRTTGTLDPSQQQQQQQQQQQHQHQPDQMQLNIYNASDQRKSAV
jgi:hypothetical protein